MDWKNNLLVNIAVFALPALGVILAMLPMARAKEDFGTTILMFVLAVAAGVAGVYIKNRIVTNTSSQNK